MKVFSILIMVVLIILDRWYFSTTLTKDPIGTRCYITNEPNEGTFLGNTDKNYGVLTLNLESNSVLMEIRGTGKLVFESVDHQY